MRGKSKEARTKRNSLSKTQAVLYQKEFRTADRMYNTTKNQV
ncbi:YfhE family protein [Aquibacillus kalidii]|nr:YfhE family protein [Aquibacillus kalidii]